MTTVAPSIEGDDVELHSIFGNLTSISDYEGCASILLIVAIVLLFEHIFMMINNATVNTPFEEMIIAIKNEMMIGNKHQVHSPDRISSNYSECYAVLSWLHGLFIQVGCQCWPANYDRAPLVVCDGIC